MSAIIRGKLILPDRIVEDGQLYIRGDCIAAVSTGSDAPPAAFGASAETITFVSHRGYVAPGFIDLHVHGGEGADFMDATPEAFQTAMAAHARHGTTGIVPTTTVGDRETLLKVLEVARSAMQGPARGPRLLGVHFYGPYFGTSAAGCHPTETLRAPDPSEYNDYLAYAEVISLATVAPELPGAEAFARACRARGIHVNMGHSHCTFEQAAEAVRWGVRHVDHLYCAMSDRAKLRQSQVYPMRGGLFEAALYFDELTTEVIADGKHLAPELLALAYKIKGPDRLALVTDCNRALDMPDGDYIFGARNQGVSINRRDEVGLMADGNALASSVMGMDHMVRTFWQQTQCPLHEAVRMATLTPARILGKDRQLGSLAEGKLADLVLLDEDLQIKNVWVGGKPLGRKLPVGK